MRRSAVRLCEIFLGVVCLASAAGLPGVLLDVPFVKQEKDGCGAASVAMVMQYWEKQGGEARSTPADARVIQQALLDQQARGIFASAMERYFQQAGFRTFVFKGEWADLRQHLSKGRPLIVCVRSGGSGQPLHYVVVAGLDWEQNLIFVNDPAERKLVKLDRSKFEKEWEAAGNWTLLAIPK